MEIVCEFCKTLKPVVHCAADAAYLCLSCDGKVHSANALSYRHERTLVCESCLYEPVHVRCFEHQMFICKSCNAIFHVSFEHHRKEVSSYVGSPSAKYLAALWGFDYNELESYCFGENRSVFTDSGFADLNDEEMYGSVVKGDNRKPNTCMILQQILDLEKLQLHRSIGNSSSTYVKDLKNGLSLKQDIMWKMHKIPNNETRRIDPYIDFQCTDNPNNDMIEEPFSQMDNFSSTDLLWQFKSPSHHNEIWLHNMQDIGVFDDVQAFDDIPDVDLTFMNFEEFFGNEHKPSGAMVDVENMAHGTCDTESSRFENKEYVMKRYKEKKILRHEKQARYASHRSKSDGLKRENVNFLT